MSRELSLDEQRKIQIEGLIYLKSICQKYDLKYYLASGTLLGAVKYQGFIPWDDDIDVFLIRDDYERLLKILETEDNADFMVLTCYNTKDYYYPYAKLVNKHTKVIDNARNIKKLGVFIDVFPLDYLDDNVLDYYHKIRFVRNLVSRRMKIKKHIKKSNFKEISEKKVKFKIFKDFIYELASVLSLPLGYNFWAKKLDKLVQGQSGNKLGRIYKDPIDIFDSKLFSLSKEYVFEGHKFTSIANSNKYLSQVYGDYKKDLPALKQCSHHQIRAYVRDFNE